LKNQLNDYTNIINDLNATISNAKNYQEELIMHIYKIQSEYEEKEVIQSSIQGGLIVTLINKINLENRYIINETSDINFEEINNKYHNNPIININPTEDSESVNSENSSRSNSNYGGSMDSEMTFDPNKLWYIIIIIFSYHLFL